jgi:hypothetical protein
MAFGCSDDDSSNGGSGGDGGMGGEGGMGGMGGEGGAGGGEGGTGGMPPLDACSALDGQQTATYEATCTVMGAIPAMVQVTLYAANGGEEFAQEAEGDLTTCAELFIPDSTFGLIGSLNPELVSATATVGVEGATPETVDHEVPGTPKALDQTEVFDEVTTTLTVGAEATVDVAPAAAELVIAVPGLGEIVFVPGEGDCGPLELLDGEESISFDTVLN